MAASKGGPAGPKGKTAAKGGDVLSNIMAGDLDAVYAFHGAERHLIQQCLDALRSHVVGNTKGQALNEEIFDLKEAGVPAVINACRTLPMFAKRMLVVARGLDQAKADALEPLVTYAQDPNPTTVLVLVADKPDKVDGRLKAFATLKKLGVLHEFARLRDSELARWLQQEAKRQSIAISPDGARALAEAAGPDLGRLSQALGQLTLFARTESGDPEEIQRPHVEALIPESRERQVFELTRALADGQPGKALALVGQLLRDREPPLLIQGALLRQLRQIWRAKELLTANTPRADLPGAIGVPPFALDEILGPARRVSVPALKRSFDHLYRADRLLKSSRVEPELLVTKLVRDLADELNRR
ncbi:MAG: DNA polymerase III subunit delta [Deltaproteobacteria bacterium]|nr:DNA polymerase III subunit delta [Deltaproteobacteria bacterium]